MIIVKDLESFEEFMNDLWMQGMNSSVVQEIASSSAFQDKKLVAMYLTQVYHYAVHTPRHQALVGVNPNNKNVHYMQYCFEHALEETGHELMALSDIRSLGYNITEENIPRRLTSTDLLISFLYSEANSKHPIHHLGYGFWSENACPFVSEFMENLMESVGLERKQLTFYSSHVTIDEGHAREVRQIIDKVAKTEEDWQGMQRVAQITFDLTLGIVRDTFETYKKMNEYIEPSFEAFADLKGEMLV